ncbi:hypothetical protein SCA04_21250 [Staphylococcus carnosus]|nr:hypothetical protein SCA04_21250 [Staphylococcus carnosus]
MFSSYYLPAVFTLNTKQTLKLLASTKVRVLKEGFYPLLKFVIYIIMSSKNLNIKYFAYRKSDLFELLNSD